MEVRITDISVSRHHSTITLLEDGTLALSDNFSKFGTLKLIQEPIAVPVFSKNADDAVYLQVGRSMVVLQALNRFTWLQRMGCCFSIKGERVL